MNRQPLFEIRPVGEQDLDAILAVYRACEDFLALGPVAVASAEMVQADLDLSRREGGTYCGIFEPESGRLLGVVDYILSGWMGDPRQAYLSLLMIAAPERGRGLGAQVAAAVEAEIRRGPARKICAGVQVNNPDAIRFWQRMGYVIVSDPENQADGTTTYALEKRMKVAEDLG